MTEPDLLSIEDVVEILDVPRENVEQWVKRGELCPATMEGKPQFHPEDIRAIFEEREAGGSQCRKRILVMEDDPLVRDTLKQALERVGHEAVLAPLGLVALDLIARESLDLVIADIRMPGMNGIEALRAIRVLRKCYHRPLVPEIILTAYADKEIEAQAQRMGIRDFVLKPLDLEKFLAVIRRNLDESARKKVVVA